MCSFTFTNSHGKLLIAALSKSSDNFIDVTGRRKTIIEGAQEIFPLIQFSLYPLQVRPSLHFCTSLLAHICTKLQVLHLNLLMSTESKLLSRKSAAELQIEINIYLCRIRVSVYQSQKSCLTKIFFSNVMKADNDAYVCISRCGSKKKT